MSNQILLVRPEGSPDLIKMEIMGGTILLDHQEGRVFPISDQTCSPDSIINYLIAEGFLERVQDNKSTDASEENKHD